ncbi:uncharacterized protein [Diadema antillarum]|uniref:uncharacterized protein n=1 Tax=Diadema antillarum TaxID=105358 RepID=UPI003A84739D
MWIIVGIVITLSVVLAIAEKRFWCVDTSSQSNVDFERGHLKLYPVDKLTSFIQDARDPVASQDNSTDPLTVGRSLPQVPGNEGGDVTTSPEYARHIFQNTSQNHGYKTEANSERDVTSSADTRSRSFNDVIHQDDKGVSEKAANEIELYMDMPGVVKKQMGVTFVQAKDNSTDEEDTDENGYMFPNVNLSEVTTCQPQTSRATMKAFDSDDVRSCDNPTRDDLGAAKGDNNLQSSIYQEIPCIVDQSTNSDNVQSCDNSTSVELSGAAKCDANTSGNLQFAIYQEIPCTCDQSPSIPEAQYHQRDIGGNEIGLSALDLNDPFHYQSIYVGRSRQEGEVDENGYLVLDVETKCEVDETGYLVLDVQTNSGENINYYRPSRGG